MLGGLDRRGDRASRSCRSASRARARGAARPVEPARAGDARRASASASPAREVVRGDLLMLAEGDRVPADARLAAANELQVDESLLTGESLPVAKRAGRRRCSPGTLVVNGQGRARGRRHRRAQRARPHRRLARHARERQDRRSSARPRASCRLVAVFALGAVARADAGRTSLTARRLAGGVLAGLTLAMAILPEEFPVVLTVFLALGAWRISRHGVLTRRMPAIETLGAATVLCVDKTGTLTENRMAVRGHAAAQRASTSRRSPASSSRSTRWSARSSPRPARCSR